MVSKVNLALMTNSKGTTKKNLKESYLVLCDVYHEFCLHELFQDVLWC